MTLRSRNVIELFDCCKDKCLCVSLLCAAGSIRWDCDGLNLHFKRIKNSKLSHILGLKVEISTKSFFFLQQLQTFKLPVNTSRLFFIFSNLKSSKRPFSHFLFWLDLVQGHRQLVADSSYQARGGVHLGHIRPSEGLKQKHKPWLFRPTSSSFYTESLKILCSDQTFLYV